MGYRVGYRCELPAESQQISYSDLLQMPVYGLNVCFKPGSQPGVSETFNHFSPCHHGGGEYKMGPTLPKDVDRETLLSDCPLEPFWFLSGRPEGREGTKKDSENHRA